ncbi:hypothetical protein [Streptomyces sp. WELS2]|uniref:hypothetical protein n=1 Tax=Streptomyces sp. WELS2 TaxID=2749435 RepID=UPI0015F0C041|nr:hypothetical protein [Streptomyces sp. WELS2]
MTKIKIEGLETYQGLLELGGYTYIVEQTIGRTLRDQAKAMEEKAKEPGMSDVGAEVYTARAKELHSVADKLAELVKVIKEASA